MPAFSTARFAASDAIKDDVSSPAIWRFLTPVRSRIHSSLVSTISERSSLLKILGGIYDPVPHIFPIICFLQTFILNFKYFDIQTILH